MSFPINNEEARNTLISGELLKVPGGLYELTFGQIPKSICHVLEKFLNVGEIYFSGFAREKELFGNIIIIIPKGTELNNREFINTFIKQAAIALQKKQAEEELRDSEERLKILFDYAPDAYYINDLKGKFIDGNKAAERVIGYKKEELIGNSFLKLKLLSTNDMLKAAKVLAKNIMGQPTGPDELVLNRKDNSKVVVEIFTYPVKIKGKTLVLGIARDITERKKAESKLQIERDKLTTIFESMTDGIYIVNKDYDIQYVNPALKRTFGSPEGKKCHKYFHDSDEPCTFCKNEEVFAGKTVHWEWTSSKYGKTYDIIETPMKNADGSISKLEIFRNITERKQAEKSLQESEAKYRAILEQSADNIFLVDLETKKILESNVSLRNLLGYSADEMKKLTVYDFVAHPKDEIKKKLEQLQMQDKTVMRERKYLRKDGSLVDVEMVRNLITFGNKKVLCVVSRDISERKQAEENLKNAKDELQMIMDSVPATIFYKDTEGRIIRANKTMANSLKLSIKDIVGKVSEELFSKEQAEKMRKDDQEVIVSGKPKRDIIHPYTTPDGIRWAITDKMPYKDKEGKVTGIIGFAKDITVQRKAEQKLKLTYQKLKKNHERNHRDHVQDNRGQRSLYSRSPTEGFSISHSYS